MKAYHVQSSRPNSGSKCQNLTSKNIKGDEAIRLHENFRTAIKGEENHEVWESKLFQINIKPEMGK